MPLNRDFDREAQTGVCSYCGEPLEINDWGDFTTCTACDNYDYEESLGLMDDDDFIYLPGFYEALETVLWADDETLRELQHVWGVPDTEFWELVHQTRADKLPATTEADAVGEIIEQEKTVPPDDLSDIPF